MTPADPEVVISAGRVRGCLENGVYVFRGMPFAKPPLGALRFRAPEDPVPWEGVRDASAFGPPVPQPAPASPGVPAPRPRPEEWLTVNVWTPDITSAGLPVLVWIHGGGYMFGSGGDPVSDGAGFAMSGVVLVSCNYRLGFEGWAEIPGAPANRGLLDQVAALRWVRENVARFGGDPSNVTVFGESAGGGSVAALLAMPAARGLFRRAIAQSVPGTFFGPDLAAEVTAAIAAEAGVPASYDALAALSPAHLVGASAAVAERLGEMPQLGPVASTMTPFSPVVDGDVLPRSPWRALLSGAARDVDLLTGHNRDEFRLFITREGRLGTITDAEAETALQTFAPWPDGPDAYRRAYPDATAERLYETVNSDWLFRMPTLHLAQAHAASGGRTFLYELRAVAPAGDGMFGACHALDVPLLFGNDGAGIGSMLAGGQPPAEFRALGDLMRGEWVRFASSGEPGWAAYGTGHRTTRIYDIPADTVSYPEATSMRLWQRYQFDALQLASAKPA
ncbi:MAG TPA: carboxylesterase family protein [Trebonia sp.]|jgi:para-nitrobenzyl esterase|nr:carboxylesterase family protein [Trebonia sp.]